MTESMAGRRSETIVVGIDGSRPSEAATSWALERAARLGADLTFLHAADGARQHGLESHRASRVILDAARARAIGLTGVGTVRAVRANGEAMRELVVASSGASLVVVGTHKTGFLRGRVLGSRSLHLAVAAHCPVAVIPESSYVRRADITVGVDDSEGGRSALRFAVREASRLGTGLVLVRGRTASSSDQVADADTVEEAGGLLAAAALIARSASPDLSIREHQVERTGAEALIDATRSSLLVVLAATGSPDATSGLGRVAHDVLLNLAGPAVIVHAGE